MGNLAMGCEWSGLWMGARGPRAFRGAWVVLVGLALAISACGGGSGVCTDSPSCPGAFRVDTDRVSFSMKRQGPAPASKKILVTLLDEKTNLIGTAFADSPFAPPWLRLWTTPHGRSVEIGFEVTGSAFSLQPGKVTTTLVIGSFNDQGDVLQIQEVQIELHVRELLSASEMQITAEFTDGHPMSRSTSQVDVQADPSTTWRASSGASWIEISPSSGKGKGAFTVSIDATKLSIGQSTGEILLQDVEDESEQLTLTVEAALAAPIFTVSANAIVLGGNDGLDLVSGKQLDLTLGTGTAKHPFTVTLSTESGGEWLLVDTATGMVDSEGASLQINANRGLVAPGTYRGSLNIAAMVRGHVYSKVVPVTFHKEGHWMHVSSLGVAFSSFPGRSVLTRSLEVSSSKGRTDVAWNATSSQPWLAVTASGTTGQPLTLTANPEGLSNTQLHSAEVTVTSSDASILNTQVIRVALHVGATPPASTIRLPATFSEVVASPVEPVFYAHSRGSDITVLDAYTGQVARTLGQVVAQAGQMAVSSDGSMLFVDDLTNHRVVSVNSKTGAEIGRFPWSSAFSTGDIAYARPAGRPFLLMTNRAYDLQTGTAYNTTISGYQMHVSAQDRYVYGIDTGISPSSVTQTALSYSALLGGGLRAQARFGRSPGGNGQDVCVSADGVRVYTASGAPYEFPTYDAQTMLQIQTLPGVAYPNNAACGWNGLVFVGSNAYYDAMNAWVYRADGSLVTPLGLSLPSQSALSPGTMVLSGDNSRIAAVLKASSVVGLVLQSAPLP